MTTSTIAPPPATRPDTISDDRVSLRLFVRVLWPYRIAITACGLAAALVALGFGLAAPRAYEAEVALGLSRSKLTPSGEIPQTANFRPFLENENIAAKTIRDLKLDQPPYRFTPGRILDLVTVEEVRNSSVILVTATMPEARLASNVANRLAEFAVDASRRASQIEANRSRDDVRELRDDAQQRLRDAENALRTFRQQSQVEALRKDIEAILDQRKGILSLVVSVEVEKARLASALKERAERPKLETRRQTLDSDPLLMETARALTNSTLGPNLLGLQTKSEYENSVHTRMDDLAAVTQTTVAGLERLEHELVEARKLNAPQLPQLTRLYDIESELSRLEAERDIAKKAYLDIGAAYETARLQVASRTTQLQVIEPALTPDAPMSRHLARNAAAALLVGALLAAAVILARYQVTAL
jgi:uncharacterized protein involved in exopolysaccharide biosynthesis